MLLECFEDFLFPHSYLACWRGLILALGGVKFHVTTQNLPLNFICCARKCNQKFFRSTLLFFMRTPVNFFKV